MDAVCQAAVVDPSLVRVQARLFAARQRGAHGRVLAADGGQRLEQAGDVLLVVVHGADVQDAVQGGAFQFAAGVTDRHACKGLDFGGSEPVRVHHVGHNTHRCGGAPSRDGLAEVGRHGTNHIDSFQRILDRAATPPWRGLGVVVACPMFCEDDRHTPALGPGDSRRTGGVGDVHVDQVGFPIHATGFCGHRAGDAEQLRSGGGVVQPFHRKARGQVAFAVGGPHLLKASHGAFDRHRCPNLTAMHA